MYHVSHVICQVSLFSSFHKVVKLVYGGFVINGAYPVYFKYKDLIMFLHLYSFYIRIFFKGGGAVWSRFSLIMAPFPDSRGVGLKAGSGQPPLITLSQLDGPNPAVDIILSCYVALSSLSYPPLKGD